MKLARLRRLIGLETPEPTLGAKVHDVRRIGTGHSRSLRCIKCGKALKPKMFTTPCAAADRETLN